MMRAFKGRSAEITRLERKDDALYLYSDVGRYRLAPVGTQTVRVTYTQRPAFSTCEKPGVLPQAPFGDWTVEESASEIILATADVRICINRKTASFRYDNGQGDCLLREKRTDSKSLEEVVSYRLAENEQSQVEKVQTADGEKTVVKEAQRVPAEKYYQARLYLDWQDGEALYGFGQHEEGLLNLRGQKLYIHQANRKIAVPMMVSSLGYGILFDAYCPMIFSDTAYGSYVFAEAVDEMDYYFINGKTMDGVIRQYRALTGKAALLPRWAFGYIQSQERYETEDEILHVAEEYRRRGIGLDGIVLDWQSWEENLWGQKTFDKSRFADPAGMIDTLHRNDVHFMISIWPNMSDVCDNYREFKERRLLLPESDIYNALSKEGRELYWQQVERGLFRYGIDAWWCDSSEPFTPEWNHRSRREPHAIYEEYYRNASDRMPAWVTNAYSLYHAQAIYEGQRGSAMNPGKRVFNLTRSGYTGQQRYGTVLWSGDTDASWDTYRKQVSAGLGFCASGLPYWTADIGAFFVRKGGGWNWKGEYDGAMEDLGYRELFTRWYQWCAFLPIFRGHGTDCRRELWYLGDPGTIFYDAALAVNRLRYELMPYIYALAGQAWLEDASIIKPLAFDFPQDAVARDIRDQYLFGSFMVCPVMEPMYYEAESQPLENVEKTRKVYLPHGSDWYDYATKQYYTGGQWITVPAPIDTIPLFVKAGSVIPKSRPGQTVKESDEITEIEVYEGSDGSFMLYEDAGDGYGYEQGEYRQTRLTWDDAGKEFRAEVVHDFDLGKEPRYTIKRFSKQA